MSDDTRSIAEIIGFTRPHEVVNYECVWCGSDEGDIARDGECWASERQPTADDLLAWLRENEDRPIVEMESANPHGNEPNPCGVRVTAYDGSYHLEFEAPTLLSALDAAVRAVAGGS